MKHADRGGCGARRIGQVESWSGGDDTAVEEDRTRRPARHALGNPLLSLLPDAKGSAGNTDPLFQGRVGRQRVLPMDSRPAAHGIPSQEVATTGYPSQ